MNESVESDAFVIPTRHILVRRPCLPAIIRSTFSRTSRRFRRAGTSDLPASQVGRGMKIFSVRRPRTANHVETLDFFVLNKARVVTIRDLHAAQHLTHDYPRLSFS